MLTRTAEMGQGAATILARIVAEKLTVPDEIIRAVQSDTDVTPDDTITSGSRSMYPSARCIAAPLSSGSPSWAYLQM